MNFVYISEDGGDRKSLALMELTFLSQVWERRQIFNKSIYMKFKNYTGRRT